MVSHGPSVIQTHWALRRTRYFGRQRCLLDFVDCGDRSWEGEVNGPGQRALGRNRTCDPRFRKMLGTDPPGLISTDDPGPIATRQSWRRRLQKRALARSAERAVDDHFA